MTELVGSAMANQVLPGEFPDPGGEFRILGKVILKLLHDLLPVTVWADFEGVAPN